MPEVAYVPLPETDAPGAARKAVERLEESFEKCRAVLVGPGLGDDELPDHLLSAMFGFVGQQQAARSIGFGIAAAQSQAADGATAPLFAHDDLRIVLDADALKWLARQESWWTRVPANRLVLTPHPGELEALSGKSASEITADPAAIARACATQWQQTVVVKSGYAAVSDGERTLVADDAPYSLAKAGSGDVLAGSITAFLAQGVEPVDAVGLALHHGTRAARSLEDTYGELGVIATDMPEALARVIGSLS
jgi:NAD(P)H-hydrate epimerase